MGVPPLQVPQISLGDILAARQAKQQMRQSERQAQQNEQLFPLQIQELQAQIAASQAAAAKSMSDADRAQAKADFEQEQQKAQLFAERMATSSDQNSYMTNLRLAAQQGLIKPDHAQQMAQVPFTPEMKARFQEFAVGQKEYLAQQETERKNLATEAESKRHNIATEEKPSDWMQRYFEAKKYNPTLTPQQYEREINQAQVLPPDVEAQRIRIAKAGRAEGGEKQLTKAQAISTRAQILSQARSEIADIYSPRYGMPLNQAVQDIETTEWGYAPGELETYITGKENKSEMRMATTQEVQAGFKYTATNPNTGERVGSNDGKKWLKLPQ